METVSFIQWSHCFQFLRRTSENKWMFICMKWVWITYCRSRHRKDKKSCVSKDDGVRMRLQSSEGGFGDGWEKKKPKWTEGSQRMESDREGKCKNNQDIGNTWLSEEEQQSAKEESLKVRLKWSGIAEVAELDICRALHYGNKVQLLQFILVHTPSWSAIQTTQTTAEPKQ